MLGDKMTTAESMLNTLVTDPPPRLVLWTIALVFTAILAMVASCVRFVLDKIARVSLLLEKVEDTLEALERSLPGKLAEALQDKIGKLRADVLGLKAQGEFIQLSNNEELRTASIRLAEFESTLLGKISELERSIQALAYQPSSNKLSTVQFHEHYARGRHNFSGLDLSGCNMSNMILRNVDFRNITMVGGSFGHARLENCDFSGATLEHVIFQGTVIDAKVQFTNSTMKHITFRHAVMGDPLPHGMTYTRYNYAKILHAKLTHVSFERSELTAIVFEDTLMEMMEFTQATLTSLGFNRATLTGAGFNKTTISDGWFINVAFTNCQFRETAFSNTKHVSCKVVQCMHDNRGIESETALFGLVPYKALGDWNWGRS